MRAAKLGDVLVSAGIKPEDVILDRAIALYLNSGGTIERARARLDVAAERMPGKGQNQDASNRGPVPNAQPRQPVEDAKTGSALPQGQIPRVNASSPNRGGEGQACIAPEGLPRSALPVREPKPQRAPIDFGVAANAIKTKLAWSVLNQKRRTSDNRAWGHIGAHELDGMSRDGALASALKDHLGTLSNQQRFMNLQDLINAETFESIRSKVYGL